MNLLISFNMIVKNFSVQQRFLKLLSLKIFLFKLSRSYFILLSSFSHTYLPSVYLYFIFDQSNTEILTFLLMQTVDLIIPQHLKFGTDVCQSILSQEIFL